MTLRVQDRDLPAGVDPSSLLRRGVARTRQSAPVVYTAEVDGIIQPVIASVSRTRHRDGGRR